MVLPALTTGSSGPQQWLDEVSKKSSDKAAEAAQPNHLPPWSEVRAHPGDMGPLQPSNTSIIQEVKHRGFFHQLSASREEVTRQHHCRQLWLMTSPPLKLQVSFSMCLPI